MHLLRPLPALLLLLCGAPALARYEPVLRREVPQLEQRKARLYVVRPCRVHPADPKQRKAARHQRLLPGDVVRVTAGFKRPTPIVLVGSADDGVAYRVKIECLSRTRPDYSYRGKGSFKQFHHGLVRDLPRLMDRYVKLMQQHDFYIPVTDKETGKLSDAWNRAHDIYGHLKWVRGQYFYMAYSGRSERTVLRKEASWITRRGEAFIRGFSGGAEPEVKNRLKKIYLLLNRLSSVPGTCGRLRRLHDDLARLGQDKSRYQGLEPAHRERLKSEDLAQLQAKMAELRTRLHTTVVEVRSVLLAMGINAR